MSRQLVYYNSKWRDVQRKWVYQSGEWVELFYDYVRADSKWTNGFLQNPDHFANVTVGKRIFYAYPQLEYHAYGFADDPNPYYEQFGSLTFQPSAILPPAPWRISAAYNWARPAVGSWYHGVHLRAPVGTPNPGYSIFRALGYRDMSKRRFGRSQEVFPASGYGYRADDFGEAWAYITSYTKLESEDTQWIMDNLADFNDSTVGQVVPWGVRVIL